MENKVRMFTIYLFGNLEGDNRWNDERAIFKEVITEDFPNCRNSKNTQIE